MATLSSDARASESSALLEEQMSVRPPAEWAIVVLGLQNDLVHSDGFFVRSGLIQAPATDLSPIVENINAITAVFRRQGWPVIPVHWNLRPDHLDAFYSIQWRRYRLRENGVLVKGSWGAQFLSELCLGPKDFLLPVTSHSAFQFTPLDRILRNCGVTRCVLVGGSASEDIDDSTRQGAAYGYHMYLVPDAIYPYKTTHLETLASRADTIQCNDLLKMVASPCPAGA
jgi:nicotinamidase-related amidase